MIMARNEDGTYSQVGFVKDNAGIDTEYIYDKDGDIVFEKGFIRETSGTVPLTINGIGKDLKDWSITGNTVQNGTPTPENPVEVQAVGDRTRNLFDKSKQARNIYVTETAIRYGVEIPVEAGIYTTVGGTNKLFVKEKYGTTYGMALDTSTQRVITLPQNGYILIYAARSEDYTVSNIMLNAGTEPLPYEPYGYKIPVVTRGKNLFDYKTMYGIKYKYLSENGEVLDSQFWAITDYIPCSGNVFTINPIGGKIPAICLYDSQKNYITGLSYDTGGAKYKKSVTIRSKINASYIRFSYYINSDKDADDLSKIQIEIGDTATPYEPYHEPITTPIYLDSPLYKIEGYADRLSTTEEVRVVKELVLTGTDADGEWKASTTRKGSFYLNIGSNAVVGCAICDRATNVNNIVNYNYGNVFAEEAIVTSSVVINLWLFDTAITLADFKAYLAAQYATGTPVKVYYVLATPETKTVEPVEIPTLNGTTVIDVDTAVKPTEMYTKYKSSK